MLPASFPKWSSLISKSLKAFTLCSCLVATVSGSVMAQRPLLPTSASKAYYNNGPYLTTAGAIIAAEAGKTTESQSFEASLMTKLVEAQKILASSCPIDENSVGISLLERKSGEIYTVTMTKTNFLTTGYQEQYVLTDGTNVTVHIDQPNYVNTKLSVEANNGLFIPLTVKYPIVKQGRLKEMAYYTPAHRSLQQHNFAKLGESYINKVLTDASGNLKRQGYEVPDQVLKIAKMLCIIEHIDHGRYYSEDSAGLFKEVLTLYALNRGDCYRYSVSSAGAGGMVQMIASTYREIKGSFPQVNLNANFESGMIDHTNAAKAMLLYLRRYHNLFLNNPNVENALEAGLATPEELMAAGYNSNPDRVPSKLTHGVAWKNALPRETQTYLSILRSLDSSVTTEAPRYHVETEQVAVYRPNRNRLKAQVRSVRGRNRYKATVRSTSRVRVTKQRSSSRSKAAVSKRVARGRHHR